MLAFGLALSHDPVMSRPLFPCSMSSHVPHTSSMLCFRNTGYPPHPHFSVSVAGTKRYRNALGIQGHPRLFRCRDDHPSVGNFPDSLSSAGWQIQSLCPSLQHDGALARHCGIWEYFLLIGNHAPAYFRKPGHKAQYQRSHLPSCPPERTNRERVYRRILIHCNVPVLFQEHP